MRWTTSLKIIFLEGICFLYILLFVYAAGSKVLDFQNFQVQLGQSPLLSAFAGWISYLIPVVELFIVLLLIRPNYRFVGLLAAFSLMVMFTTYIIIILNYSSFIPCSCGGILDKMGWTEHLFFNIGFVLLALWGILLLISLQAVGLAQNRKRLLLLIIGFFIFSCGVVTLLFVLSEDRIHNRNNFVRRFPHHPLIKTHEMDIKFNSYYLAGMKNGNIYLGNVTAPLHMLVVDTALRYQKRFKIALSKEVLPFQRVQVIVKPPHFYVVDGTVPVIFKGSISNWEASVLMLGKAYFTQIAPINGNKFIIRTVSSSTNTTILGTLEVNNTIELKLSDNLLKKQIDGLFDTDGMLLFNEELQQIIYSYYYRNQYIVTDSDLNLDHLGNTIDTTSRARLKISYIKSKKQHKLSAPPLLVNKNSSTYGTYLFVNSGLIGQYESEEMWQKASIVDVYDFMQKRYEFSFYIDHQDNDKMEQFMVKGDLIVVLMGHKIISYRLRNKGYTPNDFKLHKSQLKKIQH
jgi:hypothetical protein